MTQINYSDTTPDVSFTYDRLWPDGAGHGACAAGLSTAYETERKGVD